MLGALTTSPLRLSERAARFLFENGDFDFNEHSVLAQFASDAPPLDGDAAAGAVEELRQQGLTLDEDPSVRESEEVEALKQAIVIAAAPEFQWQWVVSPVEGLPQALLLVGRGDALCSVEFSDAAIWLSAPLTLEAFLGHVHKQLGPAPDGAFAGAVLTATQVRLLTVLWAGLDHRSRSPLERAAGVEALRRTGIADTDADAEAVLDGLVEQGVLEGTSTLALTADVAVVMKSVWTGETVTAELSLLDEEPQVIDRRVLIGRGGARLACERYTPAEYAAAVPEGQPPRPLPPDDVLQFQSVDGDYLRHTWQGLLEGA